CFSQLKSFPNVSLLALCNRIEESMSGLRSSSSSLSHSSPSSHEGTVRRWFSGASKDVSLGPLYAHPFNLPRRLVDPSQFRYEDFSLCLHALRREVQAEGVFTPPASPDDEEERSLAVSPPAFVAESDL